MNTLTLTFRPIRLPNDAAGLAQIYSQIRHEAVTEERIRDWWQPAPYEIRQTKAAVDATGRIVGLSNAQSGSWLRPRHFWVQVAIDLQWRRQGVGSALFEDSLQFARSRAARALESMIFDDDQESLRFAEKRGYQVERHSFDSVLDLGAFDESKFADLLDTMEAQGFRFFSLADMGAQSERCKRKLYDLNRATALDNPGNHGAFASYDDFSKEIFNASWFRADLQLLVAQGEEWAGLCAIGFYPQQGYAYNEFTGVLPQYRGQGLATALKLTAIRRARELGAQYIRTNNDSQNAPMLSVNLKLGYQPRPGMFELICRLL
jgi:GNAT superfamily N-acetyltransferase